MKTPLFFTLALRYLGFGTGKSQSSARKSLLGSVFGIGLSVIPLVVVPIISDGMIHGITARLVELESGHIRLIDSHYASYITSSKLELHPTYKYMQQLKQKVGTDAITGIFMERSGSGLVVSKTGRSGGSIRAIQQDFFTKNTAVSSLINIVDGSLHFKNNQSVILGKKIAEDLNLSIGDTCRLLLMSENERGKTIPKILPFTVTGIVSSGYQILDGLWVFIPLRVGIENLYNHLSKTAIIVNIEDPFNTAQLEKTAAALDQHIPKGLLAYTWHDMNRSQFYSFKTTKNLLLFILFLIVLAAAANISSAILMLVMERQKEIAILKSAGCSPRTLVYSFLTAGILTSAMGIVIGLPIALLLAVNINAIFHFIEHTLNFFYYGIFHHAEAALTHSSIELLNPEYYLEQIPIVIDTSQLVFIIAGTLLLSAIVCIIPSRKAGKLKPLHIIRKS